MLFYWYMLCISCAVPSRKGYWRAGEGAKRPRAFDLERRGSGATWGTVAKWWSIGLTCRRAQVQSRHLLLKRALQATASQMRQGWPWLTSGLAQKAAASCVHDGAEKLGGVYFSLSFLHNTVPWGGGSGTPIEMEGLQFPEGKKKKLLHKTHFFSIYSNKE